jgi:hypothetical protein
MLLSYIDYQYHLLGLLNKATNRKFPRIPHYILGNSIHQRLQIQIHQGFQANHILLLGEKNSKEDSEDPAQEEDEAIAPFALGFRDKRLLPRRLWLPSRWRGCHFGRQVRRIGGLAIVRMVVLFGVAATVHKDGDVAAIAAVIDSDSRNRPLKGNRKSKQEM